jgi:sulfur-oxidizing protein SoxY
MTNRAKSFTTLLIALLLMPVFVHAEEDQTEWNNTLQNQYFAGKSIEESNNAIELDAPIRAEDPALVPLKIRP